MLHSSPTRGRRPGDYRKLPLPHPKVLQNPSILEVLHTGMANAHKRWKVSGKICPRFWDMNFFKNFHKKKTNLFELQKFPTGEKIEHMRIRSSMCGPSLMSIGEKFNGLWPKKNKLRLGPNGSRYIWLSSEKHTERSRIGGCSLLYTLDFNFWHKVFCDIV